MLIAEADVVGLLDGFRCTEKTRTGSRESLDRNAPHRFACMYICILLAVILCNEFGVAIYVRGHLSISLPGSGRNISPHLWIAFTAGLSHFACIDFPACRIVQCFMSMDNCPPFYLRGNVPTDSVNSIPWTCFCPRWLLVLCVRVSVHGFLCMDFLPLISLNAFFCTGASVHEIQWTLAHQFRCTLTLSCVIICTQVTTKQLVSNAVLMLA